MSKLGLSMLVTPERVAFNAVRERKLAAAKALKPDVVRDALIEKRVPAAELARVEVTRRARLMRDNPEALAVRQALIDLPEVTYVEAPGVQKRKKYKGRPLARSFRY